MKVHEVDEVAFRNRQHDGVVRARVLLGLAFVLDLDRADALGHRDQRGNPFLHQPEDVVVRPDVRREQHRLPGAGVQGSQLAAALAGIPQAKPQFDGAHQSEQPVGFSSDEEVELLREEIGDVEETEEDFE